MSAADAASGDFADVCCPFCGLLCDDLGASSRDGCIEVEAAGCQRAARGFAAASMDSAAMQAVTPRLAGRACQLEDAVAAAAGLLAAAERPLLGGLATDVAGVRAAVSLAERCGAVLDHAHGPALRRNLRVLQESGWFATTLSEVRARADLVLIAGSSVFERHPRLVERVLRGAPSARDGVPRRCVLLGDGRAVAALDGCQTSVLECPVEGIGEVAGALRALVRGTALQASEVRGVPIAALRELATALREARYSAVVWAAGDLDFANADLTVEHLVGLARELNVTTRSAVLPLGGGEGDVTATQVCTWQCGYPLQVDFSQAAPRYDPRVFDATRMLASGESDALLWIACHTPDLVPPPGDRPTVVIGHPAMRLAVEPAVYLPAGVPGIDHAGHLFRTDGVVSLPMRKLRTSPWLPAAQLLARIERALVGESA